MFIVSQKQWHCYTETLYIGVLAKQKLKYIVSLHIISSSVYVGTKMRKFPLPVMNMPVRILGSVHVLAFFGDPLPELY